MNHYELPDADYGDEPGVEEFLYTLENIANFLEEDEIKAIIDADEEMLEAMDPVKWSLGELKRLKENRKKEGRKLGWWNKIIFANMWLIRPDERPKPNS